MNVVEVLQNARLFKSMPLGLIDALGGVGTEETLRQGETLFREADEAHAMYVIAMGTVKLIRDHQTDAEKLATLGTGAALGEMAMVTRAHKRILTCVAKETTQLVKIEREAIERLARERPQFGRDFYYALARAMALRLNISLKDTTHYRAYWRAHHHAM